MKATLDELAAGIRSDPRGLKRQPGGHGIAAGEHLLEAASQMRPDEFFGLSQERARQLVVMAGVAKESCSVVPSSGTGELPGLRGEGTWAVRHGTEHPLTLNYELD